jgi:hypothetical protein
MTYLDGKPQAAGASHSFGLSGIMNTDHFFAVGQFRTNRAADMLQDPTFVLPVAEGPYEVLVYSANQAELHYARFRLNVGNADSDQDVQLKRGVRVTGQISIEDPAGVRAAPSGLRCQLHSVDGLYARSVGGDSCLEREYTLGLYELEVLGMPPDAYVASALANGIDVLEKGLQLESSTELNIRLRPLGKILDGVVNDVSGAKLADAVVVLVPDPPLRSAGLRYRTAISDVNGKFELRGIAPGSYHLFAWTELEGAAYRNADFMKDFEGKGVPIKVVEGIDGLSQNITPLP